MEDQISERDVWKLIFSVQHGTLSIMISLISMMSMLSASFWDSLGPYVHIAMHTLEKEVDLYLLIIFAVLALKTHYFTALILDLEFTTANIMKMLVFSAHVSHVK